MADPLFEDTADTITAISTPSGVGGIGMVRISGPLSLLIAKNIFITPANSIKFTFKPRYMNYGFIVDSVGVRIDEVMLTYLPGPSTYTREDMVEITGHGGSVATQQILKRILDSGARIADPGEFSKRAFINGRIDLLQAEAIIDIIHSQSDKGWKTAFSQLDGKLSNRLSHIRSELVDILTIIETSIDFPDEDFDLSRPSNELGDRLTALVGSIATMITSYDSGRIYREGFAIAIVGRPNVGKSSLMNALLERERVIVTSIPGTTRDTVEETLHLDGIAVRIIDTAGVRETVDEVESIGIERTMTAIADADMALLILDGSEQLNEDDLLLLTQLGQGRADSDRLLVAINKSDRDEIIDRGQLQSLIPASSSLSISAKSGVGIDTLKDKIVTIIKTAGQPMSDGPVVTRQRHCDLLRRMSASIESAVTAMANQMSEEFIAADLREAKEALEELTGESVTDAVIDKIFQEFCIGK